MTPLEHLEELKKEIHDIVYMRSVQDEIMQVGVLLSMLSRAFDLGRREQEKIDSTKITNVLRLVMEKLDTVAPSEGK